MCKCVWNLKILIFHVYYLNMDISFIIVLVIQKMCMFLAEIYLEGSVSQNFDIGLGASFMVCRRRDFEKNHKSYPFLVIK